MSRNSITLAVLGIALLPFAFQPERFAPDEAYRAGLVIVLAVAGLGALTGLRQPVAPHSRPLIFAILIWCGVLALSTLLSISPSRALFGDAVRQMGLLMHLALAGFALLLARSTDLVSLWRWFWLAGVIVSVFVLLQYVGLLNPGQNPARPDGPLGLSVFTAGWLALAWLWSAFGMHTEPFKAWRRSVLYAGLCLMLLALILTGSRGAFLSWGVGLFVAFLLLAAYRANRKLVAALLLAVFVFAAVLAAMIVFQPSVLADIPLLKRFDFSHDELTTSFRAIVWDESIQLLPRPTRFIALDGQPDAFYILRPFIGYGLESFETFFRPGAGLRLGSLIDRPIDRAHNDWLDVGVIAGWAGLVGRLILWGSIWWVGLRRLGLFRPAALILPALGIMFGLIIGQSWMLPLTVSAGALAGCVLWLLWVTFQCLPEKPLAQLEVPALLALSVTAAHFLELQFSFTTVATALTFWLGIALLLAPLPERQTETSESTLNFPVWTWGTFAAALLIRSLPSEGTLAVILLVFCVMLVAGFFAWPSWRELVAFIVGLMWGILGAQLNRFPEWAALWDAITVFAALWLLGFRWEFRRKSVQAVAALASLILALLWWGRGTAAFMYADAPQSPTYARDLQTAVSYAPWDDYLRSLAGSTANFESLRAGVDPAEWQAVTVNQFAAANALNPYDALLAWRLALYAAQRNDFDAANAYYAAAVRLWPVNAYLWRDWASFSFYQLNDMRAAYVQAQKAVHFSGGSPQALGFLNRIQLRLRLLP